ncbi:putative FAD binding domain-containing protein [Rosellinia necatrix]|uniref:Putative FAD binding domain-containing protein n=1 Tax=Rosellinia necatrix TaxID=77044 RepID=A0A1S7UNI3_ROSNE|nr:putative FAD binding domain-containing protein [Rosellinia necatrix]
MPDFRVVVLGAGPAGLFAAHALAAAGIDFIVLERQSEVVRYRGALLLVWPPFVRLLDQLGLYDAALELSTPITTKTHFTHTGEPLWSDRVFASIADEFGYPNLGLSRGNLLRLLYENLPKRETRVKVNANVTSIETDKDGVHVHLADGSVVDGSIVIAADGVHSQARELIQRLSDPSTSTESEPAPPMPATYLSLFGHTRGVREDIALGDFAESHGPGVASQSVRLRDTMFFTVLKRLDKPTSEKKKFTSEEVEKFAQEMSDVNIFPGVKLKEIWPLREQTNAVLLHQEEGMAKKWYHGRVVIVGDAAHKMTSVNGQGALSAVLSATALVNSLRAALLKKAVPATEDLEVAFARYEASRKEAASGVVQLGIMITRFVTWADARFEDVDRSMSSEANMMVETKNRLVPGLSQSPVLDFIPFESKQGTTPWAINSKPSTRSQL